MLLFALVFFVVLPLAGALVMGAVLLIERATEPRTPARAEQAGAPEAGLLAGLAAHISQPALRRYAREARVSGSHALFTQQR
jgi:hypothetical protein